MTSKWLKALVLALATTGIAAQAAWEHTKPAEFVVPAGSGGGAEQMHRELMS